MDRIDAEAALDLINDYWPGTLEHQQIERWATAVIRTGADFDLTCQWIADHAATSPYPPRLSDICTAIRPRPEPTPPEDSGPPVSHTRGQAWASHVNHLADRLGRRLELHDHRHGVERCPVCTTTGDYQHCGQAACPICG